jgi:hypothetical protein
VINIPALCPAVSGFRSELAHNLSCHRGLISSSVCPGKFWDCGILPLIVFDYFLAQLLQFTIHKPKYNAALKNPETTTGLMKRKEKLF